MPHVNTINRLKAGRRYTDQQIRYHHFGYGVNSDENKIDGLIDLCEALIQPSHKIVVVECGNGLVADVFAQYSNDVITYCIEGGKGRFDRKRAHYRLKRYAPHVDKRTAADHATAAAAFANDSIQLVYINTPYAREKARMIDILKLWRPKCVLIGGHNYSTGGSAGLPITRAVNRVLGRRTSTFSDGSWVHTTKWLSGYLV